MAIIPAAAAHKIQLPLPTSQVVWRGVIMKVVVPKVAKKPVHGDLAFAEKAQFCNCVQLNCHLGLVNPPRARPFLARFV